MAKQFENKVVFITGGTTGIGRDAAVSFAKEGAAAVVTGRRRPEGEETVRQVQAVGGKAHFIQSDVSSEEAIEKAIAETVAKFGKLDIAFNNAGVEGAMGTSIVDVTPADFDFVYGINVRGLLLSMKHQFRQFLKQGTGGTIINNSSVVGLAGFPSASVYSSSKWAVEGLTKTAALEGAKDKIRVNSVAPGPILTDMMLRATGGDATKFNPLIPLGRHGVVEEISATVLFLASPGASYITGQTIAVDGGFIVN